jgi:hypothetical protein
MREVLKSNDLGTWRVLFTVGAFQQKPDLGTGARQWWQRADGEPARRRPAGAAVRAA